MNAPRLGRWNWRSFGKAMVTAVATATVTTTVMAQDGSVPLEGGYTAGEVPMAHQSGGSFYSQQLGAHLRVRYNTESYGQNQGNFDIGTMKLYDLGNASAFIDGQLTMNDVDHVGFNIGTGYRWLSDSFLPLDNDPMRIMGASFWVDGQSTITDDFFPQVGISLESLGDMTDLRGNLYLPVGSDKEFGSATSTGELLFIGNALAQETLTTTSNALTVGELEIARRLGNREAWAFVGGYSASSDDFSTEGFKAGLRGYALPDLFVQLAVTDDDLFKTNAVFSIGWFIGRTRTDYQPTGTLSDRLREPVLRNDYVATYQTQTAGGDALTDADGDALRFVHVDSTAAAGGDGTFANPINNLNEIDNNSLAGDIVLVHSGSVFASQQAILQANQRFLGEGGGITHNIVTAQLGTIAIPETAAGAQAGVAPIINQAAGATSVMLADANEVNNFTINGGLTAINGLTAAGDPTLRNLNINNTTGDAITLASFARPDADDADNDGDTTEVAFRATIDNVDITNAGGTAIALNGNSGADLTDPAVGLNEAIAISNVSVTGGTGQGILASNTNTGGTMTVNNYTYDGQATGLGGMGLVNADGTTTVTNSDFTGGAAGGYGIAMTNSDGRLTVNNTNTITNVTGDAVRVDGGAPVNVTIGAAVTNTAGNAVVVQNLTGGVFSMTGAITNSGTGRSITVNDNDLGSVTFTGAVVDTGAGIAVTNNTGGTTLLGGTYNLDTGANTAVTVTNNTGATATFNGLDIDTTTGAGFVASGGGTIGTGGANSITTTTGTGLSVSGMTIATGGLTFDNVTVNGATNGIVVNNTTGGLIRVGSATGAAGSGGTMTTTGDAISVTDATNVQINRVTVTNSGGNAVTASHTDSDAFALTLNGLVLTSALDAIEANANGSSTFALTVSNSTLNDNFAMVANGTDAIDFTFQTSTINTGDNDIAMDLDLNTYASADVLVQNNGNIQTIGNNAFRLDATGGPGNDVRFQLSTNTFVNNDAAAPTANIDAGGNTTLNSTITGNTFANNGGGPQFTMDSNTFGSTIRLNLSTNVATTYTLSENAGSFNLFDRDDTFNDLNNTGNVVGLPAEANFGNDPGGIPTP